jgi:hypothetical protein
MITTGIVSRFDYSCIANAIAEQVRSAADRIRDKVKRTLEDVIAVGKELLTAKAQLPYGRFGLWLQAEFGWTERTARHFMAVAERFGPKAEIISNLGIAPTAAYLLAAPSTPDEARQAAIAQAEAGRRVTVAVARDIVARARARSGKKWPSRPVDKLTKRLFRILYNFRHQWDAGALSILARHLREFADTLDNTNSIGEG